MGKSTKDLTKGSPLKVILLFAVPILFGNLLQQAYNLVDSIVVGQFIGTDAFGATSASNTLMNLFISLLIGVGTGASILISQYFGQKSFDYLKKSFSTALIVLTILTAIVSVLGVIFSKQIMVLLKVDSLILDDAYTYLRVIFIGLVPMMLFNMYSSFLRGVGNSKIPLVFLIIATVVNIILDVTFVAVFKMGVFGVAIATVIANIVSAIGIIIYAYLKVPYFSLKKNDFIISFSLLKKMLRAGFPVIWQQFLVAFSLVLLQSIFNGYGKDYTSAYGLSGRIDALVCLPLNSIAMALSSFVAQNKGANEPKRITEGFIKSNVAMTLITFVSLGIVVSLLDPIIILFISKEGIANSATVVAVTKEFVYTMGPFYFLMGIMFITTNSLSGASDTTAPIIIMSISMVVRLALAYIMQPLLAYKSAMWAFPISWLVGSILAIIRFSKGKWKNKMLIEHKVIED